MSERTAIFGGSFNPIHFGHIRMVTKIKEYFGFDRVIIMPAGIPPHKSAAALVSNEDRLEMCRLAFPEDEFEISSYELDKAGKSYTVDTIHHFMEVLPQSELFLIIGSDMLLSFRQWREYREILAHAALIAVSRQSGEWAELKDYAESLRSEGGKVELFDLEPLEMSSTEIREAVKLGKDLSGYLPERVIEYIKQKNLYK